MMDKLPPQFLVRMHNLLGQEYDEFLASYQQPRLYGLRVNTLKTSVEQFKEQSPFSLTPVPWVESGFYYPEAERPGRHPYHDAGLYYIQEPSAMAVVPILDPQPGEKILDLAAAPGGKATQLAAAMQGKGLLVANEIQPGRAKILAENMERCAVRNALVTNETPQRLAKYFPRFFDRILLDAPCSGEGMFRKDPGVSREWNEGAPAFCAARQWEIIVEAEKMLRPGGVMMYSTCTFAPEEDEQLIFRFLENYRDIELIPIEPRYGFRAAVPVWGGGNPALAGAVRLWPHYVAGEGHFVACMRKNNGEQKAITEKVQQRKQDPRLRDYFVFVQDCLNCTPQGDFHLFGDHLYILPPGIHSLEGLKVVRPGWHLGTFYKNRFEPSHALALALKAGQVVCSVDYPADSAEIEKYLRGEVLHRQGKKGWTLVTVDGYSLGWGKQSDGLLKNHYPKGLRRV